MTEEYPPTTPAPQTPDHEIRPDGGTENEGAATPRLCQALTRTGQPCRHHALADSDYCYIHQPQIQAASDSQQPVTLSQSGVSQAAPPAFSPNGQLDQPTREELKARLNKLTAEVEARVPGYQLPPFSPQALIDLLEHSLGFLQPQAVLGLVLQLRQSLSANAFDVEMWRGLWTILNYTVQYQLDIAKRRFTGEYEVDPYGFDQEFFDTLRPLFEFLYRVWWRVTTIDIEHVPATGRVLLVANHSGLLPLDGSMITTAMQTDHPSQRLVRALYPDWLPRLPFVSVLLQKTGQVLATPENAERLLGEDQAVLVFPEGAKGVGKLFKDRYHLAHFGRGGFVRAALRTQSSIVPVAIVGSEEIYPTLTNIDWLAKLLGLPNFPITPFFPLAGPLGLVPLPTKWTIQFGQPIPVRDQFGPDAADNAAVVLRLTEKVRDQVQQMLLGLLKERKSVFLG